MASSPRPLSQASSPNRPLSRTAHSSRRQEASSGYGQIIEYIEDRLYLASYSHPPDAATPFPYPLKKSSRSPDKRLARTQAADYGNDASSIKKPPPVYFSIDSSLKYNAFHADFGPLHIGHLYRFSVELHSTLADPAHEGRPIVFWSHADSRSRANAACVLACYMILLQKWPPHLALAPLAQMDPPLMPFRDAGYSQADYTLTVQDVVYGVWKAKTEGICRLDDFNLEEYEAYERVDMGDFNWLTPDFVAFASPQHEPVAPIPRGSAEFAALPRTTRELLKSNIPNPFKNVLDHFRRRNVGLVVRLNSHLYSPSYFEAVGIKHIDMVFDDGTCPALEDVRTFINLSHDMIKNKGRGIAVHCKAGLGRTGCMIGAYLIYRHGFTANEIIAFMRFMRPGMVVGPQQHWLHLNQGTFREWWFEDSMREKLALLKQSTPTKSTSRHHVASNGQTHTPPHATQKRRALGELDYNDKGPSAIHDENLPAPTPGQPRKTSKQYGERHNPYTDNESDPAVQPDTEIISLERHIRADSESEEEIRLRSTAGNISQSPASIHKRRAISCTTTTTMTSSVWVGDGSDTENHVSSALRTPLAKSRSGSGSGNLSVSKRSSPVRRSTDSRNGVRKTSGRVGSIGSVATSTTRVK